MEFLVMLAMGHLQLVEADKNALIKEFAKRLHAPIVCTLYLSGFIVDS
jgi:hypothetical protein